ncbi:DedA family protein [Sphingomonas oligophenolica]|uniref:DedA family protein n=1 Tax=Sphingomonas oligophenolica TaxID=301154 RepID=A0ABU9Y025_9SPHN
MTDFTISLIAWGGYVGIFLLMALENIFPPVPSEVIMGLGGIAVAQGRMDMMPLILWGTAGTTAGNVFWYELGRHFGYLGLRPTVERYSRWLTADWHDVERLHDFFGRHGQWVVFGFRFMPTFRTIVSLPAGMARMPRVRFLIWTAAGAAIWNCILGGAGYYLGTNFRELDRFVGPAAVGIMVVIFLLYLWRVASWKPHR